MNRKIIDAADSAKAVIFDFDGTLVDSMWMWKQIDIEYLGRFGIVLDDSGAKRLQKDIEGMSFTETAVYFKDTFYIPDDIDVIKNDWTDMSVEKYRHEVGLKPYVREFLDFLKEKVHTMHHSCTDPPEIRHLPQFGSSIPTNCRTALSPLFFCWNRFFG